MATITSLLQRLKVESKKSVTAVSKHDDIEYQMDTIELFGQTFSMKRVAITGNARYKVGWVLDNQTSSCMRCNKGFSLMMWRHHCRSCGYVVCQTCGDKKLNFEVFEEESPGGSRVCKCCYDSCQHNKKNQPKKGPKPLVSATPVQAPVVKDVEPTANLPTVVERSFDMNATLDTETTVIENAETNVTVASATDSVATDKFHVPKMRPSRGVQPIVEPSQEGVASSKPAVRRGSGLGLDLPATATLAQQPVVLVNTTSSSAAPIMSMPQEDSSAQVPPARKSAPAMLSGSLQPIALTYDYSAKEDVDQSNSGHNLAALNSSIVSTATKTTINTALNGKLTAPPPRLGVTCTAPEIFSPVVKPSTRDLDGTFDLNTPPSGGSCGSGEVIVDMSKFGSPVTRKLIMEDARCNVIWEADDDDASSTTCSSVAPTPNSGISGTTSGGAGVGYIRSPWDNTFSPFTSAQKPRKILGSGNTSAGKSGRRRKFSTDAPGVRFAAEDAFCGSTANADITNEVESSPGLPLTKEQLLFQQQYLRHQQMHLQQQQSLAAGKVPTKMDLQTRNEAENAHINVMPTSTTQDNLKTGAVRDVHGAKSDNKASAVAVGLPALGKSGVSRGGAQSLR